MIHQYLSKSDGEEVFIYIDGYLHLHYHRKDYLGMQSYREKRYTIELYFKKRKIKLEYDNRNVWLSVLDQLHRHV